MELARGYKTTPIGVIPEDWVVHALQALTDPIRPISYGIVQTGPDVQNGVQCLRVVDVTHGRINRKNLIRTTEEISLSYKRTILQAGDLVMPLRGNVGDVAVIPEDLAGANITMGLALISVRPEWNNDFCRHALSSPLARVRLEHAMNGSALQEISIAALRTFSIALPLPKCERTAIAQALNDADALIASLERLLAKKRDIKQGVMQELLTGKRRLPGFTGRWCVKPLGEIANIQRGASPRPIDSPVWFDNSSSVGWVRISDIPAAGRYLESTSQRLSAAGVRNSRPVMRDSLIMSICATVGRPVITKIDVCIHDGFVVFEALQVERRLLYYILKAMEGSWSQHGQTGSQMNLNTGLIKGTTVRLPPTPAEENAIAEILSDIDAEIDLIVHRLQKARCLKLGMAQQLLTGRTRIR